MTAALCLPAISEQACQDILSGKRLLLSAWFCILLYKYIGKQLSQTMHIIHMILYPFDDRAMEF